MFWFSLIPNTLGASTSGVVNVEHAQASNVSTLDKKQIKNIDPNAAELIVEGIAQMGVLVLRIAGQYSHEQNKPYLDSEDINYGFSNIQERITSYDFNKKK